MKSFLPLCLLAFAVFESASGLLPVLPPPPFKHGFIKGALKGLIKGSLGGGGDEDDGCQTKWEEVWKPQCTTSSEKVKDLKLDIRFLQSKTLCVQVCRSEPQQQCSTEYVEECWVEQQEQCQVTQESRWLEQ